MSLAVKEKIVAPAAWIGPEIAKETHWYYHLDDKAIAEIDAALKAVKAAGLSIPFPKSAFPLPTFSTELDKIAKRVEDGVGFVMVRGLPRDRYSDEECELIYWGIGMHLGQPVSQNTRGHLLGHVRDEGKKLEDPTTRPYQTSGGMDFHSDQLPVDILGLFCVRTAKTGGASYLVSALTVHNVLLEERPDLLEVLYQPFNLDWRGENPESEKPWYACPMFSVYDGKVTSRITSRIFFESVVRWGEELGMSDKQREALNLVQQISERPELRLSMGFKEGDMQFINNHIMLHARSAYEDFPEEWRKRHLLRMWIAVPEAKRRKLSPELADRYRIVEMGGIPKKVAA
jgi:hypothetical protein